MILRSVARPRGERTVAAGRGLGGLTRARVTQIANLTLLAPVIQEEILAMGPVTVGRDSISERSLRAILAEPAWATQEETWRTLRCYVRSEGGR